MWEVFFFSYHFYFKKESKELIETNMNKEKKDKDKTEKNEKEDIKKYIFFTAVIRYRSYSMDTT